jgi:flagellar hook-length control protein FliK
VDAAPAPVAAPQAPPAAQQTQSTSQPAPAPAPAPQRPATLQQLPAAAEATIRFLATGGETQATIKLHPEELGTVEVHLSYTDSGVTATVRADSPQAAQTLQQAAPDLRRALEAQGTVLLGLDVRGRDAGREGSAPSNRQGRSRVTAVGEVDGIEAEDGTVVTRRIPIAGAQIDVFA